MGASKSSIGHTEAASGLVGVMKAVLQLKSGRMPAIAHFRSLNPQIPLAELKRTLLEIPTTQMFFKERFPRLLLPQNNGTSAIIIGRKSLRVNCMCLLCAPWLEAKKKTLWRSENPRFCVFGGFKDN